MEESSFPVTRVMNETRAREIKLGRCASVDDHVINLTLLGAVHPGTNQRPKLLYALTTENTKAKIKNVNCIAAAILSESRVVFFSKLLMLLRCLDPRLAELCYMDTVRRMGGG
jgi:hypothetical protein